jgi:hypothetical protein
MISCARRPFSPRPLHVGLDVAEPPDEVRDGHLLGAAEHPSTPLVEAAVGHPPGVLVARDRDDHAEVGGRRAPRLHGVDRRLGVEVAIRVRQGAAAIFFRGPHGELHERVALVVEQAVPAVAAHHRTPFELAYAVA